MWLKQRVVGLQGWFRVQGNPFPAGLHNAPVTAKVLSEVSMSVGLDSQHYSLQEIKVHVHVARAHLDLEGFNAYYSLCQQVVLKLLSDLDQDGQGFNMGRGHAAGNTGKSIVLFPLCCGI